MRIIAHLDMDAFFASVEERDNPRLAGKPIVVGADPEDGRGRGVVSTANYKARAYGIRSALPIQTAWRLSEDAKKQGKEPVVFVTPNFKNYRETSARIMAIIRTILLRESASSPRKSAVLEQASIDEAYLDMSFTSSLSFPHNKTLYSPSLSRGKRESNSPYAGAETVAQKIKNEIKKKEKLTCSIGIAPNKLIAKIASDMQKPNGLTVVTPETVETFLRPLPVRKIPGIGPKMEETLKMRNIIKVADMLPLTENELSESFGKWGIELYRKIRGQDNSIVTDVPEIAKSIGEQETFHTDSSDMGFISERVGIIAREVFKRFANEGFVHFKRVVITVRFADFETKTKSHSLETPAHASETLEFEAMKLLLPFFDTRENPRKKLIRLIGVRVEKLT